MSEVWKDVPGYTGYQASDLGNIRYLLRWKTPRVLTPGPHTGGYLKVGVTLEGKTRTILVHRLIALAFIPNPQRLPQVNHINADKIDNRSLNLEWVSGDQNVAHAKLNGRYQRGEKHHNVRFTDAEVAEIRRLVSAGLSLRKVAKVFNTSESYVWGIKTGMQRPALAAAEAEGKP